MSGQKIFAAMFFQKTEHLGLNKAGNFVFKSHTVLIKTRSQTKILPQKEDIFISCFQFVPQKELDVNPEPKKCAKSMTQNVFLTLYHIITAFHQFFLLNYYQ